MEGNDPIPGWMYVAGTQIAHLVVQSFGLNPDEVDEYAFVTEIYNAREEYEEFFEGADQDTTPQLGVIQGGLMPTPDVYDNEDETDGAS